jgi:hypothetical protein
VQRVRIVERLEACDTLGLITVGAEQVVVRLSLLLCVSIGVSECCAPGVASQPPD